MRRLKCARPSSCTLDNKVFCTPRDRVSFVLLRPRDYCAAQRILGEPLCFTVDVSSSPLSRPLKFQAASTAIIGKWLLDFASTVEALGDEAS